MREDRIQRKDVWVVELVQNEQVLFHKEYDNFDDAWKKYYSFKEYGHKATAILQHRYREVKVA